MFKYIGFWSSTNFSEKVQWKIRFCWMKQMTLRSLCNFAGYVSLRNVEHLDKIECFNEETKVSRFTSKTIQRTKGLKGALSGLKRLLTIESPLKMTKTAFYFSWKALFVLKIFKFLPWLFGFVTKRFDEKDMVNLKFYDATAWLAINCNTHIVQYLEK